VGEEKFAGGKLAILAGLTAGACWGVSFLAPRALSETSASTIALFRFLFFGFSSAGALLVRRAHLPRMTAGTWTLALGLSLAGYSLYYVLLAIGVKGIGVSFATAILALLPLSILLVSTPIRGWARLLPSIGLIAVGGVLVPLELFAPAYAAFLERTPLERALGFGAALGALGLWTFFAIRNARFLKEHPRWKPLDWAGVLGISAGVSALVLFLVAARGSAYPEFRAAAGDPRVLLWTGFMGVAGAWFTSALWNFASRALPPAALGMLLVFESVFGLGFGFLYDRRAPTLREGFAVGCLIAGALLGIRAVTRPNDRSNNARNESGE
jgi:drug/metabolite transporter (DMT)-like permease